MTQQEFLRRRQALLAKMAPASAAMIFAAPEVTRSNDTKYPYRQNSDFWYFTGFNEPEAMLLLIKRDEIHNHSVLFNRVRDVTAEIWLGRRLGQDAAPGKMLVDRALPWKDIAEQLGLLLNGIKMVYHASGQCTQADNIVYSTLDTLRRRGLHKNFFDPVTMTDWRPWVHELRLIKSPEEQTALREACRISAAAHIRAMQKSCPGMYEYQLEGEIHYEFSRCGARFPAYNTIVGAGYNACILHYTDNESEMLDGQLVLIDAGCEFKGYVGDITRSFPVSGKFTVPQRAIYDIVLASLEKALLLYRPGTSIREVTTEVVKVMVIGLINLGLMHGDVDTLIARDAHLQFFMHGLSHWLGLDVHDVGNYGIERNRVLEPGMALTIEPGLYIGLDEEIPVEYRGIGIRIEDDIIITADGNENLTDTVVKNADEIEAMMAASKRI